MVVKGELL